AAEFHLLEQDFQAAPSREPERIREILSAVRERKPVDIGSRIGLKKGMDGRIDDSDMPVLVAEREGVLLPEELSDSSSGNGDLTHAIRTRLSRTDIGLIAYIRRVLLHLEHDPCRSCRTEPCGTLIVWWRRDRWNTD